jgi:hypothetical protein
VVEGLGHEVTLPACGKALRRAPPSTLLWRGESGEGNARAFARMSDGELRRSGRQIGQAWTELQAASKALDDEMGRRWERGVSGSSRAPDSYRGGADRSNDNSGSGRPDDYRGQRYGSADAECSPLGKGPVPGAWGRSQRSWHPADGQRWITCPLSSISTGYCRPWKVAWPSQVPLLSFFRPVTLL